MGYRQAGIPLPHTTSEQQWNARSHIPQDQLQPGGGVFYNPNEQSAGLAGHVGIFSATTR